MWAYNAMHDPVRIDSLSSSEELENNGISVDPKRQRARPRQNDSFSLTTKTGRLVEKCTRKVYETEPWDLFMEIVDEINSSPRSTEQAIRAIKFRLVNTIPRVVVLALSLLDTCVANCHRNFVVKAVDNEMIQYIKPLAYVMGPEGTRARELLQRWYLGFLDNAEDFRFVYDCHAELRMNEVEFPVIDQSDMSTFNLDSRPPPPEMSELGPLLHNEPSNLATTPSPIAHPSTQPTQQSVLAPSIPPPIRAVTPTKVNPTPEQIEKLRRDLNVVRANIQFFVEILSSIRAGDPPESSELLMELYATNLEVQSRLVELVERVDEPDIVEEALAMLDKMAVSFSLFADAQRDCEELKDDGVENATSLIDMTPDSSAIASFPGADGLAASASSLSLDRVSSSMSAKGITGTSSAGSGEWPSMRRTTSSPTPASSITPGSAGHLPSLSRTFSSDVNIQPILDLEEDDHESVALHGAALPDSDIPLFNHKRTDGSNNTQRNGDEENDSESEWM